MGNFFLAISPQGQPLECAQLFAAALRRAPALLGSAPTDTFETPTACAAVFARLNGSQSTIARHAATGSWLLAIGSWFHNAGFAAGEESRLLDRYLEVGALRLAQELEGFFVLAVRDARPAANETVIITDIVGSCGCFIRRMPSTILLSGSSLLLASVAPSQPDEIACQEFLRVGIIYEDRTLHKEVRKIGPASIIRFGPGAKSSAERYWSVTSIEPESIRGADAAPALWHSLSTAATRVGRAFAKPVCDLTGGYDSRALVSAFWATGVPISTVVSGPASSPDVVISRRLAEIARLPHFHNPPRQTKDFAELAEASRFTDGEYDLLEYSRIFANHRALLDRFDATINGSFGEVARGYWWELLWPRAGRREPLDARKVGALRFGATTDQPALFPPHARLDLASHFAGVVQRSNASLSSSLNTMQMDHAYLAMRMQRWQGRIASATNRVWPCLSPFMFRSVLETMLATEVRLRRRGVVIRQMLAEFRPEWAAVPLEHGYPAIPATWRNIHKFAPVLGHYAGKVWSKAASAAGLSRPPGASHPPSPRASQQGSTRAASSGSAGAAAASTAADAQRQPGASPAAHDPRPARLRLWSEDAVRLLLDPATMRSAQLLDRQALASFLLASQSPSFPFDSEWSRLLTLEHTLRLSSR